MEARGGAMQRKPSLLLLCLIICLGLNLYYVHATAPAGSTIYGDSATSFDMKFPVNSAFSLQSSYPYWNVTFKITGSDFYGTPCSLTVSNGSGSLTFTAVSTSNMIITTDPNMEVDVNGTINSNPLNILGTNNYVITWGYNGPYNNGGWLFPFTFLLGMVGLGCLFYGPISGIIKFRQHEYRNGFIQAVIITAVGIALFMAWLWH